MSIALTSGLQLGGQLNGYGGGVDQDQRFVYLADGTALYAYRHSIYKRPPGGAWALAASTPFPNGENGSGDPSGYDFTQGPQRPLCVVEIGGVEHIVAVYQLYNSGFSCPVLRIAVYNASTLALVASMNEGAGSTSTTYRIPSTLAWVNNGGGTSGDGYLILGWNLWSGARVDVIDLGKVLTFNNTGTVADATAIVNSYTSGAYSFSIYDQLMRLSQDGHGASSGVLVAQDAGTAYASAIHGWSLSTAGAITWTAVANAVPVGGSSANAAYQWARVSRIAPNTFAVFGFDYAGNTCRVGVYSKTGVLVAATAPGAPGTMPTGWQTTGTETDDNSLVGGFYHPSTREVVFLEGQYDGTANPLTSLRAIRVPVSSTSVAWPSAAEDNYFTGAPTCYPRGGSGQAYWYYPIISVAAGRSKDYGNPSSFDMLWQAQIAGGGSIYTYLDGVSLNQPPNAPTLNGPASGTTFDRSAVQRFSWTPSDPDIGDTQSQFDLQYRLTGGTWTTVSSTTPNSYYDFAAGTFAAGNYEWQVRTYDSMGVQGPWSASSYFTAADAPSTPTITAPTSGATVSNTATLTWSAPNQTDYEWRRVADNAGAANTSTVYQDSGDVVDATTRSVPVTFDTNNRWEHLQVRIKNSGLWSSWADARVDVSFTQPTASTVTSSLVDDKGFGFPYALKITDNQATQASGNPSVSSIDVFVRETGDASTEIRLAAGAGPNSSTVWFGAKSGVNYEAKIRSNASNGTSSDSAWTALAGPVTLHGVVLYAANDPAGTISFFQYNDMGATDTLTVESTTVQYQGRQYPVIEFGEAETYTVSVPKIQGVNGSPDAFNLQALIAKKTTLCYRDRKGRKVFGAATTSQIGDRRGGEDTALTIVAVDYTEGV